MAKTQRDRQRVSPIYKTAFLINQKGEVKNAIQAAISPAA